MDKVDLEFVAVIIGVILLFFVLGGIGTLIRLADGLLCWLGAPSSLPMSSAKQSSKKIIL
jgi:hypothetical protein